MITLTFIIRYGTRIFHLKDMLDNHRLFIIFLNRLDKKLRDNDFDSKNYFHDYFEQNKFSFLSIRKTMGL